MDPSAPHNPEADKTSAAIPRSRPDADAPLVGEVIPKGVPIGRVGEVPPGPAPARKRRQMPWRRVLLVVAGVLALGCLGGLGVAYYTYDQVTQLDRSDPVTVVDQYVAAVFGTRDSVRASQFTCEGPNPPAIDEMLRDIETREKEFSTKMTVTTANFESRSADKSAVVTVDLRVATSVSRSTRRWEFQLEERSDWRVCDARRIA